jgi:hypothetical protein
MRLAAALLLALATPALAQPDGRSVSAVVALTDMRYAGEAEQSEVLTFSDPLVGLRYSAGGLLLEGLYGRVASANPAGGLAATDPAAPAARTLSALDVRGQIESPFELGQGWVVPVRLSVLWRRVRSEEVEPDDLLRGQSSNPEFSAQALRLGGGVGWRGERVEAILMGLAGGASRDFGSSGLAYGAEARARIAVTVGGERGVTVEYAFRLDGYDFGELEFAGEASSDIADYYALQHAFSVGVQF